MLINYGWYDLFDHVDNTQIAWTVFLCSSTINTINLSNTTLYTQTAGNPISKVSRCIS